MDSPGVGPPPNYLQWRVQVDGKDVPFMIALPKGKDRGTKKPAPK